MAMSERKDAATFCESDASARETIEKLEQTETEVFWKLEALDGLFRQTNDHPEEFHNLYVQPLLDAELSLETALELLVAGIIRPN